MTSYSNYGEDLTDGYKEPDKQLRLMAETRDNL